MASATAAQATAVEPLIDVRPAAVLRGTASGLEAWVDATATIDAIASAIENRIAEAPAFFRGSDIRIRVEDGPLAIGSLARLEEQAQKYQLRIVEISAAKKKTSDAVPQPNLAAGSAPSAVTTDFDEAPMPALSAGEPEVSAVTPFDEPTPTAVPRELELATVTPGARLVVGPVRSGVILDHTGHLIVFGDVNPGAEVRATGNIIVLGRLRGMAHAGIGQDVGFILALQLQPAQLRIGRQVARAADSDKPLMETEIAYATGEQIVVERYTGKLPRNLATSI